MSKISYNGAGYRPEIEDVWAYDEEDSHTKDVRKFVSHFITYAQKRNEVRNQALAEIEYNLDENI